MKLRNLATLGPIGYFPISGTIGSLVAVPFSIFLSQISFFYFCIIFVCLFIVALYSIKSQCETSNCTDPKEIVIDEVLGLIIAFYNLNNLKQFVVAFILFRFFDITKIFFINKLENIKGPSGIILDDLAAGLLANVIARILF